MGWEDGSMTDCLFCSIVGGDIPADVVFRDDDVVAFRDIDPKAPVHVLVIPTAHHANAADAAAASPELVGRLIEVAGQIAADEGVADSGYRIVTNTGDEAGQSVHHLHLHVLGGRTLTWPPG
jgi:histidine triad (HIT) family protein